MPTSPVSLTVTPGYVFPTSSSRIGATELNAGANPTVQLLANGALGPDFLDMTAVAEATGDAATRNYLQKGSFAYEDWQLGTGITVPAAGNASNAQGWYARPTGGPVTVLRAEDSPGNASTWSAELQAGTALTSLDYYTWIPPAVGSGFRAGNVTFSLWVKNLTIAAINCRLICDVATNTNEKGTLTNQVLGTLTSIPVNTWTRLTLTVNAATVLLQKGSGWGLRTTALTTAGNAIRIAEAQFENTAAATTYSRPAPPPASLAFLSRLTDAERVLGFDMTVQLANGELRLFPPPPPGILKPILAWNKTLGIPEWIDSDDGLVYFNYTGSDQLLTVPSDLGTITAMQVYCWGGGGCNSFDRPGGVGGYSWGQVPVSNGQTFTLMVGAGGYYGAPYTPRNYGFGGSGGAGGLSGLFSGTGPVLITDSARALLIAGGGGVSAYSAGSGPMAAGGNGNDPGSSGAEANFGGAIDGTGLGTPGGGGYAGGGYLSLAGKGGTGHRRTSGTAPLFTTGAVEYTARTTPVTVGQQLIVPGSTSPYYQNQAGLHGKPGLIVIKWIV